MQVEFKTITTEQNIVRRSVGYKNQAIPVGEQKTVDVVEITYPNGDVGAFPADEIDVGKSNELGREVTFAQAYARQYRRFKDGGADKERAVVLKGEIEAKQAELKALEAKPKVVEDDEDHPAKRKTKAR